MKKALLLSVCAAALVLTSCSTYQYTARQTDINRQEIQASPTLVDIKPDFSKRVDVTSGWHKSKEDAMAECRFMAITGGKIDLVVDPIYRIEFRPTKMRKKYKATLVGFGGYYTNGRTLFEDIEAVKDFSLEDIEKYLILNNPDVLKYLNAKGEVVNIYHNNDCPQSKKESAVPAEPASKEESDSEFVQPANSYQPANTKPATDKNKKNGTNKRRK